MRKKLLSFTLSCLIGTFFNLQALTIQSNSPEPIDLKKLLDQHNQKTIPPNIKVNQPPQPQKVENKQPDPIIPKPDHTIIKGLIQTPEGIDDLPKTKILFAGQQTVTDSEGFYSFNLNKDTNLNECSFLICNQINSNFDGINTIESTSINPNKKHRFFTMKKIELKENKYKWKWTEKTLQENDFVVPQNCIVILINPKYVEKIDEWKIQLIDGFIGLPKIVLKNDIQNEKLNKTGIKSHLYTLDNRLFHETVKQESKKFEDKPNVQVLLSR